MLYCNFTFKFELMTQKYSATILMRKMFINISFWIIIRIYGEGTEGICTGSCM